MMEFASLNPSHALRYPARTSGPAREIEMAKGQQRSNREAKKPKKDKIKVIAAAPSQKGAGWQPTLSSDKKK